MLPTVVSSWLDVLWVVDHFWYTLENVECEKHNSFAVLDTRKPGRLEPTYPIQRHFYIFSCPFTPLNDTHIQSRSQLSQVLKFISPLLPFVYTEAQTHIIRHTLYTHLHMDCRYVVVEWCYVIFLIVYNFLKVAGPQVEELKMFLYAQVVLRSYLTMVWFTAQCRWCVGIWVEFLSFTNRTGSSCLSEDTRLWVTWEISLYVVSEKQYQYGLPAVAYT
jgi:hypothetical protein